MPIQTDSEAWKEGKDPGSIPVDVLEFLSQHPEKAFTSFEICDEVLDTDFDKIDENHQLQDKVDSGEIDWEEYQDQKHDVSTDADMDSQLYLQLRIRKLIEEDLIEARSVDISVSDINLDADTIAYYTYAVD